MATDRYLGLENLLSSELGPAAERRKSFDRNCARGHLVTKSIRDPLADEDNPFLSQQKLRDTETFCTGQE